MALIAPGQHQTALAIELCDPAGGNHRGRACFLDQSRTLERLPAGKPVTIEHLDRVFLAVEHCAPRAARAGAEGARCMRNCGQLWFLRYAPRGDTIAHDLHRSAGHRAIARRVDIAKRTFDPLHAVDVERDGDRELERLAGIAHIKTGGEASALRREAASGELDFSYLHETLQSCTYVCRRNGRRCANARVNKVAAHTCDEESESGKIARHRGNDNGAHRELLSA